MIMTMLQKPELQRQAVEAAAHVALEHGPSDESDADGKEEDDGDAAAAMQDSLGTLLTSVVNVHG